MEVAVGKHAGKSQGVGRASGDAEAFPECEVNTLITLIAPPSRRSALGRVELELVGLHGKALTRDATRRLQFVVHAAGWQHSTVLHGRTAAVSSFR